MKQVFKFNYRNQSSLALIKSTTQQTMVATFANDTAILAHHSGPKMASPLLQKNLNTV